MANIEKLMSQNFWMYYWRTKRSSAIFTIRSLKNARLWISIYEKLLTSMMKHYLLE